MNILITGGSGFVGKYTLRELVARGHNVFALVRRTSAMRFVRHMGATPLRGDLFSLPSHAKFPPPDVVIHLAGAIKVSNSHEFYRINAEGTSSLIRWLPKMALMHFIHVSSISARGPDSISEKFNQDSPVSHYGKSKLKSESEVLSLLDRDQVTIVRPPVIYGPGDQATLPLFRMFSKGHFFTLNPEQRLSFACVEDVARLLAALPPLPTTEIIYPEDGTPNGYSIKDITNTASEVFAKPVHRYKIPLPLTALAAGLMSAGAKLTGFSPLFCWDKFCEMKQSGWTCYNDGWFETLGLPQPIPLKEGMAHTRKWYEECGWLK